MTPLDTASPFIGAIAQELLHWYQLRERLDQVRLSRLLRSVGYWVITVLVVLVSGAGALIYFNGRLTAGEMLIAGAAFPTLFKKLATTFVKERATLGGEVRDPRPREHRGQPSSNVVRDYLAA